jgi:endonuclease YncB( thermonuclease family)
MTTTPGSKRNTSLAAICLFHRGPIVLGIGACLLALGLSVFTSGTAGSAERLAGPVPARVMSVLDGDTIEVRARIWLGQEVRARVRLAGIDAPELDGGCMRERDLAAEARAFLVSRLTPAGAEPAEISLRDIRYGKFAGRVLARVEAPDGEDLGHSLLAAGLARPYNGGRRAPWCPNLG